MSHFGAAFDDLVTQLNANTNAVSAQFDKLHAELAAAADAGDPITQAQLDALAKINDHLKAMGADERAPLPAVPAVAAVPVPVAPVVVVPAAPVSDPVPGSSSS